MISPECMSNSEIEREARERSDPLLQEAVRRLIDGEGDPQDDFDAYQDDVDAAESEADRLRVDLEAMGELCQEAAKALRCRPEADDLDKLIDRLEDA